MKANLLLLIGLWALVWVFAMLMIRIMSKGDYFYFKGAKIPTRYSKQFMIALTIGWLIGMVFLVMRYS